MNLIERNFLEDEFGKTIDLIKHYANLQFAELSVLMAIAGAGVGFIFGSAEPQDPVRSWLIFAMAGTATCFWVIWESNSRQMWHFIARAKDLERALGYGGYSRLVEAKRSWFKPGTWAFRTLYIGLVIFWLAAAFGVTTGANPHRKAALPNPSVEARPNGGPPGPPSAFVYHAPVGPGVPPSAPPHLERWA